MFKTRDLTEAALLCAISVIFQLMPVLFSEIFTLITLISTIPIYLITRKQKDLGIVAYFVTGAIVFIFSLEEFIIFTFLNGLIGLCMGLLYDKLYFRIISSVIMTLSIIFINFVIGIPLFGAPFKFNFTSFLLITIFSFIYTSLYKFILRFLTRHSLIKKYLSL